MTIIHTAALQRIRRSPFCGHRHSYSLFRLVPFSSLSCRVLFHPRITLPVSVVFKIAFTALYDRSKSILVSFISHPQFCVRCTELYFLLCAVKTESIFFIKLNGSLVTFQYPNGNFLVGGEFFKSNILFSARSSFIERTKKT